MNSDPSLIETRSSVPASDDASTRFLLQLCLGYFAFYVATGLAVKIVMSPTVAPDMSQLQFLIYNTLGASGSCFLLVVWRGWFHLPSTRRISVGPLTLPIEMLFLIPSGVCTAVLVPATTLLYSFPISVMVAMVIMRGAVIVLSRLVDVVLVYQGLLKKRVVWEENAAVVFALAAVTTKVFFEQGDESGLAFQFYESSAAMGVLSIYIVAYGLRIYIMNYFKNTRPVGAPSSNQAFFGIEQIVTGSTMMLTMVVLLTLPQEVASSIPHVAVIRDAVFVPHPSWITAAIAGIPFGAVAIFSVLIFLFRGRTATFAGLVNRLTSLVAGTTATLLYAALFGGPWPTIDDWGSLALILVAVGFLVRAELRSQPA